MGGGASQREGLDGLGAEFGGSAKLVHYGCKVPQVSPSATRSKGFLLRLDVATEPTNQGTHEGQENCSAIGRVPSENAGGARPEP